MALFNEVTKEIGGTTYTFKIGVNQMIALEEYYSTPEQRATFQDVFARAGTGELAVVRKVVHVALSKHHPDMTEEQAGELIDLAGADMLNVMGGLAETAAPDAEDLTALGVRRRRPRIARTA